MEAVQSLSAQAGNLNRQAEHQALLLRHQSEYNVQLLNRLRNLETSHRPMVPPIPTATEAQRRASLPTLLHPDPPSAVPAFPTSTSHAPPVLLQPDFRAHGMNSHSDPAGWDSINRATWDPPNLQQRELRLHKLNPPPKFEVKQLDAWMRHIRFWRELYRTVDEHQILPTIGLAAVADTRDLFTDYLEGTKGNPQQRPRE